MPVVTIHGKPVKVEWTSSAARAMEKLSAPLLAEMELYFSCLIRKKVRFYPATDARSGVAVNGQLQVRFHPVMTRACGVDVTGDDVPLEDMPLVNPAAFVPHWLSIDYRRGEWTGEFGFS
jgi:hypothetical protein